MKRRQFFRRLAAASTAFIAAPGVFKCLPAQKRIREVIVGVDLGAQKAFVEAFFFSKPFCAQDWQGNWSKLEPIVTAQSDGFGLHRQLMSKWQNDPNSIATQS